MKRIFLALLFLISYVLADVSITSPTAGATYTAGASVTVKWKDDDSTYSFDDASTVSIVLITGTDSDMTAVSTLLPTTDASSYTSSMKYTFTVDATVGSSGLYFLQIYTVYDSATTMQYSPRFYLKGMTGTSVTATGDVDDTPAAVTSADATTINSASFSVTYTAQTGKTRYAPMQKQPGTTVTATTWTRRFATSAVTYYSTISPNPVVISTVTPGWSYSVTSDVNWATPASNPSTWYAASERITQKPSLKSKKKRRWIDI